MVCGRRLMARGCFGLAVLAGACLLGGAGEDVAVATIPAFNAVFDRPAGVLARPVHTNGMVLEGSFTPTPAAALLSKAAHLAGSAVPVTVRLSTFAGMTGEPDTSLFAAPYGMAIKFRLNENVDTDIVAHSYNGFPAATPAVFLAFLQALASHTHGPPAQDVFGQFLSSHAAARTFIDAPKPPSASWGNETFFGVNAFAFVDASGHRQYGRYRIVPSAGKKPLEAAQVADAAPDYLRTTLAAELAEGPVSWHILVQLAAPGDLIEDGSIAWPDDRPMIDLGLLRLDRPVADNAAAERDLMFSPLNLVPGIEPSADPMLAARSRAYGESYRLRAP